MLKKQCGQHDGNQGDFMETGAFFFLRPQYTQDRSILYVSRFILLSLYIFMTSMILILWFRLKQWNNVHPYLLLDFSLSF